MDYEKTIMAAIYIYAAGAFLIGAIVAVALYFIVSRLWNHLAVV